MTNNASHFGIHQLLRHCGALFRVRGIVFCHQFQGDLFAIKHHARSVEFINGHASTVFIVLAQMGVGATQRGHMTDFDDGSGSHCGRSSVFFFAASGQKSGSSDQGEYRRDDFGVHGFLFRFGVSTTKILSLILLGILSQSLGHRLADHALNFLHQAWLHRTNFFMDD